MEPGVNPDGVIGSLVIFSLNMVTVLGTLLEAGLLVQMLFISWLLYGRYRRTHERVDFVLLSCSLATNLLYPVLLIPFVYPVELSDAQWDVYNAGYYLVGFIVYGLMIYGFMRVEKRERGLESLVDEQAVLLEGTKGRVKELELRHFERMLGVARGMIDVVKVDLSEPLHLLDDGLMALSLQSDDMAGFEGMSQAVQRLGAAVEALGVYADAGDVRRTLTDFNGLVGGVVKGTRVPDGVDLCLDSGGEFLVLNVDSFKLSQVVSLLIDIVLSSFSGEGVVRVSVEPEGGEVVLRVADGGSGGSSTGFNRLFNDEFDGFGLAYCRDIVEAHGGVFSVDSDGALGFTVRLPGS